MTERDSYYTAGYHYAEKKRSDTPSLTVAMDFANRFADEYAAQGLTPAEAWKTFRQSR